MSLPHALERVEAWAAARTAAGRFLLALDFDGTLAPIVDRPGDAAILPAARDALVRLLRRGDTAVAVVSGRGLEDVRSRLALGDVYYAGNHGMEIDGPGVHRRHPEAVAALPAVRAARDALRERLASWAGVEVEDKGLTLSVHYRRAPDPAAAPAVEEAVRGVCAADPRLRWTAGKMVAEIRPAVEWDKGRATRFLLDALHADHGGRMPAAFIGDDRTDEDAFRALREDAGETLREAVLVADDLPARTAATSILRSPDEVAQLLDRFDRQAP